jgi:hypothetical protein
VILTSFFRAGRPRTKGSLRAWCTKGRAHKVHLEEETKDSSLWRAQMAKAAQVDHLERHGKLLNWGGPVGLVCHFLFMPTPEVLGGKLTGRAIPAHRTPFPTSIDLGDLDKLTRNLGDALEDAHVIENDRLIVSLGIRKTWCPPGQPPGVIVELVAIEVPAHV